MKWILFIAVIVIIIFLFKGASSYWFNRQNGASWSGKHSLTLMGQALNPLKTAQDHFIIGSTYINGRKSPEKAVKHYLKALDGADDFILQRIRDHTFHHPELFGRNELRILREPIIRAYQNSAKKETKKEPKTKADVKAQTVASMKPEIKSDSQNVHDSNITREFSEQFSHLKEKVGPVGANNINEFYIWLQKTLPDRFVALRNSIESNCQLYDTTVKPPRKFPEKDVIAAVWRRIMSNSRNQADMLEALALRLEACFEDGHPVCTTGRCEQILSALATLDQDPGMGILRTTDLVKGQMYSQGSKIINNELAKLPKNIQDAYNKSEAKKTLDERDMAILRGTITHMKERIVSEVGDKSTLAKIDTDQVVSRILGELNID